MIASIAEVEALIIARGAAVQVVPEIVVMLIIGKDIATSCLKFGHGLLEPGQT